MAQGVIIGGLLVGSYLLGSMPFGLWIAQRLKGIDIRAVGSGNIGATNVGRVCGPAAGALVFCLDVAKGLVPPLAGVVMHVTSPWQVAAGMLAIIGHNYSIWLRFKGGKGIATSMGALIGIAPLVLLPMVVLFFFEYLTLRYVSLGSLLAALSLPILMPALYPHDPYRLAFSIVACVMAVYKHRANIQRLRQRTEPKVTFPWAKGKTK